VKNKLQSEIFNQLNIKKKLIRIILEKKKEKRESTVGKTKKKKVIHCE